MQGRTRSFFEDTAIIFILLVLVFGGYQVYDNFLSTKNKSPQISLEKNQKKEPIENLVKENNTTNTLEDNKSDKQDINKTITITDKKTINLENQKVKKTTQEKIKKEDKQIVNKQIDPQRIANLVKNVDLKVLKSFLKDIKLKVNDVIQFDDTNSSKNILHLRVTVLKDGSFEQLKLIDGNKELFDNNKNNIESIFPLQIDEKIIQDFPRYVRIKIDKR